MPVHLPALRKQEGVAFGLMNGRTKDSIGTAIEQLKQGDFTGLGATLDAVVARPEGGLRAAALATMAIRLGDPRRAAALLSHVASRYAGNGFAHAALGCYHREVGDDDEALDAFHRATEVEPADPEAWYGLGTMLDERGEHQRALVALETAAERGPRFPELWRQLGDTRAALGRFESAVSAYDRGLLLAPGHVRLAFHRCRALSAMGQVDDAREEVPRPILRELGELREVSRVIERRFLVCRYWATDDIAELFENYAEQLLDGVEELVAEGSPLVDGACIDLGTSPLRIVASRAAFVLCDADCDRNLQPDRFLECNEAVSILYAQALCLHPMGLEPYACPWTDLVRVDEAALDQPHVRLRRREPSGGESGWVLGVGDAEAFERTNEQEMTKLPVYELRRLRPALTRFLTLPAGAEVEVHGTQLVELRFTGVYPHHSPDRRILH